MAEFFHLWLFLGALLLPVVVSVLVLVVPTRRKEASGITLGNPLHSAPIAPREDVSVEPLVYLCRELSGVEMEGYVLGLRHLPIQRTAPLLERHIRGSDPALQLYSQAVLQEGKDALMQRFHRLQQLPVADSRFSAWLLETGLLLASSSLNSVMERTAWLDRLRVLTRERLGQAPPTPALLAIAVRVFNEAGTPEDAEGLLRALPQHSPLRDMLTLQTQHLLHQRRLAA
jgi:hypothetical protein